MKINLKPVMASNNDRSEGAGLLELTRDLCKFASGVVVPANEQLFARLTLELPLVVRRYPSGTSFNGWLVPQSWRVVKAAIRQNGDVVFDGLSHALAVAAYSKSFNGELDWNDLKAHLVTNADLPEAFVYHSMWQYRPWDADWMFSVPYEIYRTLKPGRYDVKLITHYEPGEMLVAEYEKQGRSERTIVFNAHTCHPQMANDDFAGVAVLIRLFQWLLKQDTYYTYRLILGPEHLGTVFYLRDQPQEQLERFVGGVFSEMPGTSGPIKIASSFLGNQPIDRVFRHAARHYSKAAVFVPWRQGAGNDETVWEAPGYEVPFIEVSRSESLVSPYREYHTSLDTTDLMDQAQLEEFLSVFRKSVEILEQNAVVERCFDGLISLSNPDYDLYFERPDPAVNKNLAQDSEKWGYLLDCLLRYLDGSMTILDIAEKHDLPFEQVHQYLSKFKDKKLVDFKLAPIARIQISKRN